MIYEYRVYEAVPGRLQDIVARFRNHTVELFEKHGIKNVGYWTPSIGGYSNELVYIVGFEDVLQRERAWESFRSDPEWHKVVAETEANGPIVARISNMLLNPTDYSPLQ
mgnify:FL=1|jgi:hypothetical protein